jgi:5-bromo-4-chloroindolyl phosphate hydrolysis protein
MMANVKKHSVAPFYAVGIIWLIWAFFFPLYHVAHYLMAAGVSVVAFIVLKLIFPDRVIVVSEPEKKAEETKKKEESKPAEEAKPKTTGNPEIDALILERDRAISEMRRLNDSILDEGISAQIEYLEKDTQKIIDQVVAQPSKLPQIRQFLNYYLPTTLKLLNAYDRMDATGISGTNIDGAKGKIETMLSTICTAFDKQLDALFGDEALDISTDITVMEQMLTREGIGGMQMPGV